METKLSALELAIAGLVNEFHKAANDGAIMNATQFQTVVSTQIPAAAKKVDTEEKLRQVLEEMGVENDQNISFDNFWKLVNQQAIELFHKEQKDKVKCNCVLQ